MIFSWCSHLKFLHMYSTKIIDHNNIFWIICKCFMAMNSYAAQFAISH